MARIDEGTTSQLAYSTWEKTIDVAMHFNELCGPIAALSYGPAYVDEVGILCDLNGAIWSAGALARKNGMIVPRIAA